MQTVLNYRIIIQPDRKTGSTKATYTAYCPTLGVVDDGLTVEEALLNVRGAIEAYISDLIAQGENIPEDFPDRDIVTTARVIIDSSSYAETATHQTKTH